MCREFGDIKHHHECKTPYLRVVLFGVFLVFLLLQFGRLFVGGEQCLDHGLL